ncbi:MAG: hypothetical protein VXZ96_14000 [Myxococcota bacterium]|nr:hypothetical protein [Myxococcota bacterium]
MSKRPSFLRRSKSKEVTFLPPQSMNLEGEVAHLGACVHRLARHSEFLELDETQLRGLQTLNRKITVEEFTRRRPTIAVVVAVLKALAVF